MSRDVPVVLFCYARPDHLRRTLDALAADRVPRVIVYSDGPRDVAAAPRVAEVRRVLDEPRGLALEVVRRDENLGLGRSILAGVGETLSRHDAAIVFEDDLVCVPGTHAWLCAALEHYRDTTRVSSVSAWNHPRLTPSDVGDRPYFSGRGEIWGWGTWARAWRGMDRTARALLVECRDRGIDPYRYGADLPLFAEIESDRNLWAVRFILAQMLEGALTLCPPWSMVENIGFGEGATNASFDPGWSHGRLEPCPPIPTEWPEPVEHPEVRERCRRAYGEKPGVLERTWGRTRRSMGRWARRAGVLPAR